MNTKYEYKVFYTSCTRADPEGGSKGSGPPLFSTTVKLKKKKKKKKKNAALCDICGDWLDHCSSSEHLVPVSVIPVFALNLS